jgi:hypothetical protein
LIEAAVSKARASLCHKTLGAAAIQTELFHRFRKDPFTVSIATGKDSPSRPSKFLKKGSVDLPRQSHQGLKPGRVKIGNRSRPPFPDPVSVSSTQKLLQMILAFWGR